ncbi:T6SS phospholipase effector Tle1-like catalytic domain-containing protein [Chryseobacterium paridis]|uniref:DUF2235 domain-containing protein n=1 Tax=Chryseobacterium paridis TaxID=2800328 RepID=A0ABS1FZG2_9FLAO|nr:DUF2235 domain-containing protein [Chryseobacterium paridis]MBK1897831.1 DUF2235 domain-containing protein [Chryseobacterium paridis]
MENNIISIGIFFDGTGNNGINATSGKEILTDYESYHAVPTNIYKLFELFSGNEKIYIEGIGTVTGAEDSDFAKATCKNPAGCSGYSSDDKLRKAYVFIDEKMKDKTNEYQFYVYGFGRGAMLARNFCHELLKAGSLISGKIKVRFLGAFDTVESAPFNNYNVNLLPGIENALQICAVNECRYFFPLTGFFEESRSKIDSELIIGNSVWKEIFVPGVHADIGGGYLDSSQSVYVSNSYFDVSDVNDYVSNIEDTAKDSEGNEIWDPVLRNFHIDKGEVLSQGYVEREMVYNDLSKVYGKLMVMQTNAIHPIFNTDFSETNFKIDDKHSFLGTFYLSLAKYISNLTPQTKPFYDYKKLADYTHISANFGLYKKGNLQKSTDSMHAEMINNSLNVPSKSLVNNPHPEMHILDDVVITDFAYGSNIPNNDDWSRSILI